MDLGKGFESALQWAEDAQPGLGFGFGLAGAIIGEGSPVMVSSSPMLWQDIIVYCYTPTECLEWCILCTYCGLRISSIGVR